MLIIYGLLLLFAMYKLRFANKGYFKEEVFSRNTTDHVKGIIVWLVFLSHFADYAAYSSTLDALGNKVSILLGQSVVAPFLMYSGYGICESYRKRGANYIHEFPKNRIMKTILHFDVAVCIFWSIGLLQGQHFTFHTIVLSMIGWESLGNSNWYIFVILLLYVVTWISFIAVKKNIKLAVGLVSVLTIGVVIFLRATRPPYWYNTSFCYVMGMWISIYRQKIVGWFTKNLTVWCGSVVVLTVFFLCSLYLESASGIGLIWMLMRPLSLCLLIIFLLLKFQVSNSLFEWSGKHTFEIYILQRIPMIIFASLGLDKANIYLYFALCVAVTILMAMVFGRITDKIDSRLFSVKEASKG